MAKTHNAGDEPRALDCATAEFSIKATLTRVGSSPMLDRLRLRPEAPSLLSGRSFRRSNARHQRRARTFDDERLADCASAACRCWARFTRCHCVTPINSKQEWIIGRKAL